MDQLRVAGSMELALFRVTAHPRGSLLPIPGEPGDLVKNTIDESPSRAWRKRSLWKIGNVAHLDEYTYLKIGRTRISKVSKLDGNGNFFDEESPEAPYAHIFIDRKYNVFGVSKKIELAPSYSITASHFVDLLNSAKIPREGDFFFQLRDIYDPQEFMVRLKEAYSVSRLWIKMLRKNPWDAERDFIHPMGNILEGISGEAATTEWEGQPLLVNQPQVENIIKSVASTGGDAGATIRDHEKSKHKRIRLKKGLVTLWIGPDTSYFDVFQGVRSKYLEVRSNE